MDVKATMASEIPAALTTLDSVETRIGMLDFTDGMPSRETLDKVYDHLDFVHAFEAFVNALQGVSSCTPCAEPTCRPASRTTSSSSSPS